MLIPEERIIYNNYYDQNIFESEKQFLFDEYNHENNWCTVNDVPDAEVWESLRFNYEALWNDFSVMLRTMYESWYIVVGEVQRWNGSFSGGKVFGSLREAIEWVIQDCDYIKVYDENGKFKIQCSHHDGTNNYLIKAITETGYKYIDRWEHNWSDKRSKQYIYNQVIKRYSHNLNYANRFLDCPKKQYKHVI